MSRRLLRSRRDQLAFGVCGGLAERTGIDAGIVRLAFIAMFWLGGVGLLVYAFLAVLMPESGESTERVRAGWAEAVALGAIALAGLFAMAATGLLLAPGVLAASALLLGGGAVVVRQLLTPSDGKRSSADWRSTLGETDGVRITIGGLLVAGGVALFILGAGDLRTLPGALAAGTVVATGFALLVGPRVARARAEAAHERTERARTDERIRVAARLHDSVLQTLALVQRADDAATARAQARRQERELRSWLYDEESQDGPDTLASAMSAIATDVETGYGVVVELVQHRDAPFDPALSALADAARETIVNAAKHSGAETVSVFVQLAEREAVIFVRDEGRGFDPAIVPTDRHGLRDSVVRRLAEHDGTARVTTTEGQGTEVELHVPRMSST